MIEMFLAIGGIWFWALTLAYVLGVIFCLDDETYGLVVFFTLVVGLISYFFGRGKDILDYYMSNPVSFLIHMGVYIGIGALYSVLKWFLFVKGKKNKYLREKETFMGKKSNKEKDAETLKKEWMDYNGSFKSFIMYLTPSHNTGKITFWIIYWPFSLLSLFLRDFLREVAAFVMNRLESVYSSISKSQFSDIEEDLK
jgi:uncharacterized membrane protein